MMRASPGLFCLWVAVCTCLLGAVLAVMWVPATWSAVNDTAARDHGEDSVPGIVAFWLLGFLVLGLVYLVIAVLLVSAVLIDGRPPSAAVGLGCLAVALSLAPCAGGAWIGVLMFDSGLGPYISDVLTGSSIAVMALVPVLLSVTGITLLPNRSAADRDLYGP